MNCVDDGKQLSHAVKENLAKLKPILEDQITFWNVFDMLKLI